MRTLLPIVAVTTALIWGGLTLVSAENARFRFLAAVYGDTAGPGLHLPEGVACGPGGLVIVADTGNDRLVRFTFEERAVKAWTPITMAELTAPTQVQLDPAGRIYALDGRRRRVVRLSADGQFLGALTVTGVPPPSTIVVKAFQIGGDGRVYLLDVLSARVLVLDGDGRFQKALPLPADARFVGDIAVDDLGSVLALDSIGRRLYVARRDATAFSPLGPDISGALVSMPTSLAADRGLILVVEGGAGSIASIGQDGAFVGRQLVSGWREGALNHPARVCVNDRDEAWVADRDNSRLQVFTLGR